jgi:CshA-type fibril repeat protein
VTLPGKGTFVLNSNGTVTFTAVLGWTGTATVQYRVTDASGQSAEAPVTVTVVAPAAPTVTGGTGTTITTVPANVTPQVSGLGSICLVDPADNVCKQTVTIPGKGTFVLNSNGTVTFTAVAGFIGTVTVQLQITTAYGQVARGPVTFIVGPTSQLQTGATTGTTPVNLAPSTKPEAGSACLVDPSDAGCKNVVTVPSVGTWNLNPSTGAVTFKAVDGDVGTTIVQYRVTRAGFDPTLTPFVVTVAKKRPPVTVTIGGFNPGSPILTTEIKGQIAAFMKAYVGYKTIECIGFTMGPTVLKVDKWLSTTRASNACDYILKTLKSKVTALPLKNKMETTLGSSIRRITLTLRD